MFSSDEVFVSPNCEDSRDGRGLRTLRSPPGRYDIGQILARLPAEQHPELVVVKIDATLGNVPCGLSRLSCPKVLVLGDTHHLDEPIRRLLDYAVAERFDLIVSDHDRHHLHFFREAGFPKVGWIPCLSWRPFWHPPDLPVERDIVFVGQVGAFHPWRGHVLENARRAGLPLWVGPMPQEEAARAYATARGAINCSLNGDLNLRTFEILGAGGLLMNDRLAPASGMDRLFEDGRHYVAWRSPEELVEKGRYYLDHPAEAAAIRRAGRALIEAEHHPEVQRGRLMKLLFEGREYPPFSLDDEIRCRVVVPVPRIALETRVAVYERLQAIHKAAAQVRLFVPTPFATTASDGADLPRLVIEDWAALRQPEGARPRFCEAESAAAAVEHVLVLAPGTARIDELLTAFRGCHVFIEGGRLELSHDAFLATATALARWGFVAIGARASAFVRRDALTAVDRLRHAGGREQAIAVLEQHLEQANTAVACVAWADLAEAMGAVTQTEQFLARAVRLDRNRRDALLRLGRMRLASGDSNAGYLFLNEARRLVQPLPEDDERPWRDLDATARTAQPLSPYVAAVAPERRAPRVRPRRILLVTNLFPPEEMGGYGRKLWEFADSLVRRGHFVRVLTGSAEYLRKPQQAGEDRLEPIVARILQLYGVWKDGKTDMCTDMDGARAMVRHNTQTVLNAVQQIGPDAVVVGNVDYLGLDYIAPLLEAGIPVIHSLGSRHPSYTHEMEPRHPLYLAAPASRWVAEEMKAGGWAIDRWTVLYPGARTQYFYRLFLPETDRLRIFFAGLVLPYKGPQTVIHALALLHGRGIDFHCTLAGDTTDQAFVDGLKNACQQTGMAHKVGFVGFQDRAGLAELLNAHNVVVFPSIVLEAFGIVHVEAMAAGLACVTTATGGGREIVRDGIDGLLFEPQDANGLAAKLLSLHQDRALWRRLQQAGRERALEFSVERSADVLEDSIESLITAKGAVHA
ncbi:MAG: glycosyltransferase [Alphaproteobacteria bacterium]|nr:glycosyltransferase [Alphaproteobacteria bacterium]